MYRVKNVYRYVVKKTSKYAVKNTYLFAKNVQNICRYGGNYTKKKKNEFSKKS